MIKAKALLLNPYLHLTCLILVIAAVFNRTLGTYFLADDFGEVAYVAEIAKGNLDMLWANFSGNYMQIPSMSVWRPWLLVTLLVDFIVWKANPFGYYLTNLLFYIGTTLSLYCFVSNLTSHWCKTRQSLAAFFSALVFALSPLHCESISWVVGRVDIVCAFFYLLCLNAFTLAMRKKQKKLMALSVVSFWLAMWTKEMAIGAPILALVIALLWDQPALQLKKALRLSAPLLLSTVLYFVLRYLALGTLLGGYTQGIGDAQAAGALAHWLDPDTARRLFFPLAYSIFGADSFYLRALALVYTLLGALVLLRVFSFNLPLRWLIFLPLWLVTALAPIYKLWGLGYELEGARFVFFATMPLSALLPVLLFAPQGSRTQSAKSGADKYLRPAYAALSLSGLLALSFLYARIASHLNLEWVHAGKEVRSFAEQARILAAEKNETIDKSQNGQISNQGLPLLAIPKRRGGAHMVLNGSTFQILLRPPFVTKKLHDPFLTYDPIIFGNADFINATRLKADLKKSGGKLVYWDSTSRDFKSLTLAETLRLNEHNKVDLPLLTVPGNPPSIFLHSLGHALFADQAGKAVVEQISAGDGLYFAGLALSPLDFDLLEVKLKFVETPQAPATLTCSWQKQKTEKSDENANGDFAVSTTIEPGSGEQTVYLRPSQNYRWYEQKNIDHLFLQLPPHTKIIVQAVRLLKATDACPQLTLNGGARETTLGNYSLPESADMTLSVVPAKEMPAQKLLVDISKPNAFFENFSDKDLPSAVQATVEAINGQVKLPLLPAGANYQLRARAVDASGALVGAVSDPLVLRINK